MYIIRHVYLSHCIGNNHIEVIFSLMEIPDDDYAQPNSDWLFIISSRVLRTGWMTHDINDFTQSVTYPIGKITYCVGR